MPAFPGKDNTIGAARLLPAQFERRTKDTSLRPPRHVNWFILGRGEVNIYQAFKDAVLSLRAQAVNNAL